MSILPANFPMENQEKQNRVLDSNMEKWRYIQELLDKIRSIGIGWSSTDGKAPEEAGQSGTLPAHYEGGQCLLLQAVRATRYPLKAISLPTTIGRSAR